MKYEYLKDIYIVHDFLISFYILDLNQCVIDKLDTISK